MINKISDTLLQTNLGLIFVTLVVYIFAVKLYARFKNPLLNPLLVSGLSLVLLVEGGLINLSNYLESSKIQQALVPFLTISFAIPLYRYRHVVFKHLLPLVYGSLMGLFLSIVTIYFPAKWFNLPAILQKSLLVKSVTTSVGVELVRFVEGSAELAALSIFLTGLVGYILAPPLFRLFKISDPVARGYSLGLAAHVMGAAKAEELGDVEVASAGAAVGVFSAITAGYVVLLSIIDQMG